MCQLPGQETWKLFGISSFVVQCGGLGFPAVFVRVVNYLDWINNILS